MQQTCRSMDAVSQERSLPILHICFCTHSLFGCSMLFPKSSADGWEHSLDVPTSTLSLRKPTARLGVTALRRKAEVGGTRSASKKHGERTGRQMSSRVGDWWSRCDVSPKPRETKGWNMVGTNLVACGEKGKGLCCESMQMKMKR